jgi:hypothetical protein
MVAEAYPSLSPLLLKSMLLYSAYIPNIEKPMPCTSGGILFKDRVMLLAKLVTENPNSDVQELALEARRQLPLSGESLSESYIGKLKSLWNQRLTPNQIQ